MPRRMFSVIRAGLAEVTAMPLTGRLFSCHIRLAGPTAAKPQGRSDSYDEPAEAAKVILI
jgi:hypothetical protein